MTRHFSDNTEHAKPTLVLLHGAAPMQRVLDHDAIVLGRGRGCDLTLDAPDISTLHCIISHGGYGFQVRDCGSRAGTKVNGERVQESTLHDGDLLQIGPFCFRLDLPALANQPQARPVSEARLRHLERSRRNFARLALLARRQLLRLVAESKLVIPNGQANPPTSGLRPKSQVVQNRLRELDQRLQALDSREHELNRDRLQLNTEAAAFQIRTHEIEEELEMRRVAVERDVAGLWEEFRERCRKEEERLQREQLSAPASGEEAELHVMEQERETLDQIKKELQHRAEQLDCDRQALHRFSQESTVMQENLAREHVETSNRLAQQSAAIAQGEAQLREQRTGLLKMMAELRKMQEAIRSHQGGDVATLRAENEQLKRDLEENQERLVTELQALRKENEDLLAALTEQERDRTDALLNGATAPGAPDLPDPALENAVKVLREELDRLREQLAQKDQCIDELQKQAEDSGPMTGDPQSIEAELNRFRRQLEADRKKLNLELEAMRERNQELDDETRKLEMEMSKDRAEMGRERARLERLRDEMRMESERMERTQRDQGVRARLNPLQKLRDDMNAGKAASAKNDTPK